MSIESDFFKRSRPDFTRLKAAGFRTCADHDGAAGGHTFCYREELMDGQFRAEIRITDDGKVSGQLIDMETEEEYLPIRVKNQVGEFVGEVREEYLDLLGRIEKACFIPVHFMFDQSNRIEGMIYSEFRAAAAFPWEKYPGNGTYKCQENEKWFAAMLTVEFGKLGSGGAGGEAAGDAAGDAAGSQDVDGAGRTNGTHEADEIVEVINLKADPAEIPQLVQIPGIYPAWHMNKKNWISVILDDTVTDDEIMKHIHESYRLASTGKGTKVRSTGAWMIPSNPKIYDVDAGFRGGRGVIEWHQHNQVKAGDHVFIYSSAPYSAIMYHCEVVEADLIYRGIFKDSKGYSKSMRIRLIEKYPPDKYPLSFIKAHGGSVVRSARSMPQALFEAMIKHQ